MKINVFFFLFIVTLVSCSKKDIPEDEVTAPYIPLSDKIIDHGDGNLWLYGGQDEEDHFNITNNSIRLSNLKYGLGRELFNSLRDPQYTALSNLTTPMHDSSEIILIHATEGKFAYPIELMVKHEVVNDVIDGIPVLVSYCILADFIGVFPREYCKQTLTFGVSGYTYYQNGVRDGRDGFILWDRDTESLWWPIINKGMSGTFLGASLDTDLPFSWERTTMGDLRMNHTDAKILKFGQFEVPPENWTRLEENDFDCD